MNSCGFKNENKMEEKEFITMLEDLIFEDINQEDYWTAVKEAKDLIKKVKAKQLILHIVSNSTTPNYLDDKYKVKWLINNTYQVEQNGNCVYQGSESDCNEWLKCQLGYCG